MSEVTDEAISKAWKVELGLQLRDAIRGILPQLRENRNTRGSELVGRIGVLEACFIDHRSGRRPRVSHYQGVPGDLPVIAGRVSGPAAPVPGDEVPFL